MLKQYDFAKMEAVYQGYTLAELTYALTDARKAIQAFRGHEREGYYTDDACTIHAELNARRDGKRKERNFRNNSGFGT